MGRDEVLVDVRHHVAARDGGAPSSLVILGRRYWWMLGIMPPLGCLLVVAGKCAAI